MKRLSCENGSALIESLLLLMLLLPFGFAVVMLGKLNDLRQTAVQASRYGVWETTVYDRVDLGTAREAKLVERFFTNSSAELTSDSGNLSDHPAGEQVANGTLQLWLPGDTSILNSYDDSLTQKNRADIQIDPDSVTATYRFDLAPSGVAASTGQLVAKSGSLLEDVSGNEWGLVSSVSIDSVVNVELAPNKWLASSGKNCLAATCMQTSSTIMASGWSSADDEQVRKRVRSLVPASAMQQVGKLLSVTGGSLVFPELKGLEHAFGHVDTTVLPDYLDQ